MLLRRVDIFLLSEYVLTSDKLLTILETTLCKFSFTRFFTEFAYLVSFKTFALFEVY